MSREDEVEFARRIKQFGVELASRRRSLPAPLPEQESLIAALREGFAAMPPIPAGSSEAEQLWVQFQADLRDNVVTRDPRKFLCWDVITRTMFTVFSVYAIKELRHLRRQPDWQWRWKPALRESPVGSPTPFLFYPMTSANLVHHVYALCRFEESTGSSALAFDEVLEFGGGYGSLCRLFFRLGFAGAYSIFDLAPFSLLQSYYLNSLGIPASCDVRGNRGVRLLNGDLDFRDEERGSTGRKRLFVAAWSLSETPLSVREKFLAAVADFDGFLIAYQDRFGEVDNQEFFRAWKEQTARSVSWNEIALPHIPGRHTYLFGARRATARRDVTPVANSMGADAHGNAAVRTGRIGVSS